MCCLYIRAINIYLCSFSIMSIVLKTIQANKLPVNIRYRKTHVSLNNRRITRKYWVANWNPYPVNVHEIIARLTLECKTIAPMFSGTTVRINFLLRDKREPAYLMSEFFDVNCILKKVSDEYAYFNIPRDLDTSVRYWVARWDPFPPTIHKTIARLQQLYSKVSATFTSDTAVDIAFSAVKPVLGSSIRNRHFDKNCTMIPRIVYTQQK